MKTLLTLLKVFLIVMGVIASIFITLSFTDLPYYAYHRLGTTNHEMENRPDVIVVMGAGGMPSPEGLMRCYYSALAAKKYDSAQIVIAMPTKKAYFYASHPYRMFKEIHLRGIDSTRFAFEINGMNTREQAVHIAEMYPDKEKLSLMVITSPQHLYRSVKAIEKVGFKDVGGVPSFEKVLSEELLISPDDDESKITNLNLRYNMWNYMKYQIIVVREYIAISYYWLKGWI